MNGFYDDPYRQVALAAEALSWRGCPFHLNGRSREGVGCAGLLLAVHMAMGAVPPLELPRGTGRAVDQKHVRRMSAWLALRPDLFAEVDAAGPQIGDIITYRYNGAEFHMGLYLGYVDGTPRSFIQSAPRFGVGVATLIDPTYESGVEGCWRVLDTGEVYKQEAKS